MTRPHRAPRVFRMYRSSSPRRRAVARRSRSQRILFVSLCLVVVVASGVVAQSVLRTPKAAAADEASVSISPSTDLSSGQIITATDGDVVAKGSANDHATPWLLFLMIALVSGFLISRLLRKQKSEMAASEK